MRDEIEKKNRFVKQQYYEIGPKATRLLAKWVRKQQASNTTHKIRDFHSNHIKHIAAEIDNIFKDCYKNLHIKPPSSNENAKKRQINSLDLPTIGNQQNSNLTAQITVVDVSKAILKLKGFETPGSDGFPSEWYWTFKDELIPLLPSSFN